MGILIHSRRQEEKLNLSNLNANSRGLKKPVLSDSLKSQVFENLKSAIFAGMLEPGQVLREMHLARHFSVSQATVREALLQLEQVGLAIRAPNRGTTVTKLSPKEVLDRLAVRARVEPLACIQASALLTSEDFQQLEDLASEIDKSYAMAEPFETGQLDLQFHRYIWQKSGSAIFCSILEQVTVPLFAFSEAMRKIGYKDQEGAKPHGPIVEALRGRNPEHITQTVEYHCEGCYSKFTESEREYESDGE